MLEINPIELVGTHVSLEPLILQHKDDLYTIAQDEKIWTYHASNALGNKFFPWFEKSLTKQQTGECVVYAVRRMSDHKIIGSTRYYEIAHDHFRLAIGNTWYIPEVWGSYVNPECKFLLLQQAFETLKINRVELKTDFRNERSRAAIKKLGAKEEGILRQHMVLDSGLIRDTVVFSITKNEWPEVAERLSKRLKNRDI